VTGGTTVTSAQLPGGSIWFPYTIDFNAGVGTLTIGGSALEGNGTVVQATGGGAVDFAPVPSSNGCVLANATGFTFIGDMTITF
jgi:hypothetical protein